MMQCVSDAGAVCSVMKLLEIGLKIKTVVTDSMSRVCHYLVTVPLSQSIDQNGLGDIFNC